MRLIQDKQKMGGRKPEYVLYICMAYRGDFTSRPRDHERKWMGNLRGVAVRRGTPEAESGKNISRQKVEDAEALLILWHQPERNTQHKESYRGRDLTVVSGGSRGPLARRISTGQLAE